MTSSNSTMTSREGPVVDDATRAVVVGLGGIGGVLCASLSDSRNLVAVTNNDAITAAVRDRGLTATLQGSGVRTVAPGALPVATRFGEGAAQGPFDLVFLAVPPNAAVDAAQAALPHLAPDGLVVCLQNGLVEESLASVVGADRVVGGVVAFGASMTGPGVVEQTSSGGITLGRFWGSSAGSDRGLKRVAAFLGGTDALGEIDVTSNLRGARWSKLAINCAVSSLGTIGGDRLGSLMRHRFGRRLCLEVMTEVTQVAVASGVSLEKVSGTLDLEWLALSPEERLMPGSPSLLAKHTVLLAVGAKYRRLRSSMLAAIERGRTPPVDWLNGEVVRRAPAVGVPVPVNTAIVELVHALGRREQQPSLDVLRRLFDDTRDELRKLRLAA
jgi:2-dehydropantoate 2-reductase